MRPIGTDSSIRHFLCLECVRDEFNIIDRRGDKGAGRVHARSGIAGIVYRRPAHVGQGEWAEAH